MADLTLENVTKHFDDGGATIVAVDDVSIRVADGEFLVLVGPSGCGKSTTLRMVAGLEDVTDGELRIDGTVVNDRPPQGRNIAMVFQSYALYPHMTVRENMSFGLEETTNMAPGDIDERVVQATETMDIEELLDRKPGELSGGQQQRVALGRAIVRDPEVFLMDEPLSNLDAKLRAEMRTELQRLQEELGVTTVYVTHDQTEAMTMGDRIAILDDGELQQVATPLECYHEPANRFVAGFLGEPSMNFLELERDGRTLRDGEFEFGLSHECAGALNDATAVTLGIRPEDIAIKHRVEDEHDYPAVVDVVEPRGDENTVHFTFAGGEYDQLLTLTTSGTTKVNDGDDIVVRLPEEVTHFFDSESGETLVNREFEGDVLEKQDAA